MSLFVVFSCPSIGYEYVRVCGGYVCQLVANIGKKGSVQTLFSPRSVFAGGLQRCLIECSILSLFILQFLKVLFCVLFLRSEHKL